MYVTSLGTPDIVAVDEQERVVLLLDERPAVESGVVLGDLDGHPVAVVGRVPPLVSGVVVAFGSGRPLAVGATVGAFCDGLGVGLGVVRRTRRVRTFEGGVAVAPGGKREFSLPSHPLLALELRREVGVRGRSLPRDVLPGLGDFAV